MIKYRIDRKTPDYITLDMNDFLHSFSIDTLLEEGLEETFKMVNGRLKLLEKSKRGF